MLDKSWKEIFSFFKQSLKDLIKHFNFNLKSINAILKGLVIALYIVIVLFLPVAIGFAIIFIMKYSMWIVIIVAILEVLFYSCIWIDWIFYSIIDKL